MRTLTSLVFLTVFSTTIVACSADPSVPDEPAPAEQAGTQAVATEQDIAAADAYAPASPDAKAALGVDQWASYVDGTTIYAFGFDNANNVKIGLRLETKPIDDTREIESAEVRIDTGASGKLEYKWDSSTGAIEVLANTFGGNPAVEQALALAITAMVNAEANLGRGTTDDLSGAGLAALAFGDTLAPLAPQRGSDCSPLRCPNARATQVTSTFGRWGTCAKSIFSAGSVKDCGAAHTARGPIDRASDQACVNTATVGSCTQALVRGTTTLVTGAVDAGKKLFSALGNIGLPF